MTDIFTLIELDEKEWIYTSSMSKGYSKKL